MTIKTIKYDYDKSHQSKINNREKDIKYARAIQQPDGSYINERNIVTWYNSKGRRHNSTGPAVIFSKLSTLPPQWYLNGKRYLFKDWLDATPESDKTKLLLRLQYA
jgi:hypothetical protein